MMRDIKKQAAMIGILFPTLWPVSTIYDRAQYIARSCDILELPC